MKTDIRRALYIFVMLAKTAGKQIYVLEISTNAQPRLRVVARMIASGHRGENATIKELLKAFWWPTFDNDLNVFAESCIHCVLRRGGSQISRLLGRSVHGTEPIDLVQ